MNEMAKRQVSEDDSFAISYAETEEKNNHFIGEVHDTITYPDGRVEKREKAFNIVVDDVSRLIAALIKSETGYTGGSLYWALGVGNTTWDASPHSPASTNTRLVAEVFRKPITAAQRSFIDANGNKVSGVTNRLQLDIVIASTEANGNSLREFGIFGGNASATKDSGIQINHKAHARIDKVEGMTIERSVRFTF